MENLTGNCLCGAVKYVATSKPIATRACWCRLCQTLAAGNATINLVFPRAEVTITGELSDFQTGAESGNKMHRKFWSNMLFPRPWPKQNDKNKS